MVYQYIGSRDNSTSSDWLNNYLAENLPNASAEDVSQIAQEIVGTITRHRNERQSLLEHLASSKSAESWFAKRLNASELTPGEQAYKLAECDIALDEVSTHYTKSDEQKCVTIDSVPVENWDDSNWNHYKLKDAVSQTVKQAGAVALESLASGLVEQVTGYSIQLLPDNMELGEDILTEADDSLKIAVAGALEVAASEGILPIETSASTRSILASVAIDNVKILHRVVSGKLTLAEGMSEMQTQSILYTCLFHTDGSVCQKTLNLQFSPLENSSEMAILR